MPIKSAFGEDFETLEPHDLSDDRVLRGVTRIRHSDREMPVLAGIPLFRQLGKGGMGAVYYGVDQKLEREVAVKVLLDAGARTVKRFFREAQIGAKIRSPHLVQVHHVGDEHGLPFAVMEFVRGGSAYDVLKNVGPLPETDALQLCLAATRGLDAAHQEGIVHRDIKPANILVRRSREGRWLLAEAKLADLGLARFEVHGEMLTADGTGMGTPGYMAPEQITDAKSAGKRADVFSMGATLYCLLAGKPPFEGKSVPEVLMNTAQRPHPAIPSLRPDVSPATARLIDICLQKDAMNRYADALALLAALEVCLKGIADKAGLATAEVATLQLQTESVALGP